MELELRTGDDDRAARIVDALAEQVLAEAALLALEHVGQRLQRTLVGAGDGAAAAAVVEQSVDRFLKHALFVADDDVRSAQLHQPLQAVVAVDDAAIEVVEVRRREAAAVERNQRAKLGRDDRNDFEDHPLRTVAGLEEALDDLQALDDLLRLQLRLGRRRAPRAAPCFSPSRSRSISMCLTASAPMPAEKASSPYSSCADEQLVLGQQLVLLERGQARLDDDIALEVEDALELLQLHVEQQADAARKRLQEPDVRDRSGQLDVAHALAADLRDGHLDAALLADDALVLHALVLAAQALVVLDRAEDARAEQAVTLGLERAVVDGLRLLDLAERPAADLVGRRDADRISSKVSGLAIGLAKLVSSFIFYAPDPSRAGEGWCGNVLDYSAAMAVGSASGSTTLSSSTLRPRLRISLTSTLKLSGMPASNVSSPLTIAS